MRFLGEGGGAGWDRMFLGIEFERVRGAGIVGTRDKTGARESWIERLERYGGAV